MQTVAETTVEMPSGLVLVPENRSAWMAVRRLLRSLQAFRSAPFPLLYLHGGPGTGKTHLLQFLQDSLPEEVTSQYLRAADWPESPDDEFRRSQMLIIEDMQHLPRRALEDLKRIVDCRLTRKRITVFSALHGPAELENLPAFLASRLAAGLIVGIPPYSRSSRRILLQQLAQIADRPIQPEVLDWLAEHVPGSGRQLQAALCRVQTASAGLREPIDVYTVAALFQTEAEEQRISIERIVERIGREFAVTATDIGGEDRQPQIVWPRQLAIYLARKWTGLSLAQIGECFGGRDHSTVRHACQKVESVIATDAEQASRVRQIEAELGC
ncbi:MAG TPA: helix-turn-helix domain-containing protein [Gemmataceae bacterium]|nr:helix-turn-helix domain-containing protein [Gemmataceae bacterium]